MPSCAAKGCRNKSIHKIAGVAFHRIPEDAKSRNEWLKALGREHWNPGYNSYVCSEHFRPDSFYRTRRQHEVKHYAVPNFVKGPCSTNITMLESSSNKVVEAIMSMSVSTPNISIKLVEERLLQKLQIIKKHYTGLHAACLLNSLELVKLFIHHGADVNALGNNKKTPLHIHLDKQTININIVDYLIRCGADLTITDSFLQTHLYIAVKRSHVSAVRSILQHPCSVNALNSCNMTALMEASAARSLELINMLLHNGADPTIETPESKLAVHYSVFPGNGEIFKILLEKTFSQLHGDCSAQYSLPLYILTSQAVDCMKIFVESPFRNKSVKLTHTFSTGILFCHKYKDCCLIGCLLSYLRSIRKAEEMFDVLLEGGMPVNSASENHISPLTAAIVNISPNKTHIEKLIYYGADVNYPNPEAPEAMICSVLRGETEILQLLFQHSSCATPDSILNGYDTEVGPVACIRSNIIELLLKLGLTPSSVRLLNTHPSEVVTNHTEWAGNICTLQQLSRIAVRNLFRLQFPNLSINEIKKELHLPSSILEYLRYKTE